MNQSQRSPRDHIVKDGKSNLPKVDLENYQHNFKNLLQFNHSSRWIKALNISLIQSTKNELNNSLFGRFELINIYPTSSTP